MRFPLVLAAAAAAVAVAAVSPAAPAGEPSCAHAGVTPAYAGSVRKALGAKQDIWGNALIARPNGPTYGSVKRLLKPLLFARSKSSSLTSSGVYYLPFAQPLGVRGAQTVALHVADGSEILSQTAKGPSLKVFVGPDGHERYGSCLARLSAADARRRVPADPQTQYVDTGGTRYQPGVVLGARARHRRARQLRPPDRRRPARQGRGRSRSYPSAHGAAPGSRREPCTSRSRPERRRRCTRGWLVPYGGAPVPIDQPIYDAARQRLVDFWVQRLGDRPVYDVPERVVTNAERSLLVQDLALTWRYSVGNQYEEFSFAEALDAAEVMAEYGLPGVTKEILRSSLTRLTGGTSNWRAGEKLTAAALYFRLSGDRAVPRRRHAGAVEDRRGPWPADPDAVTAACCARSGTRPMSRHRSTGCTPRRRSGRD